MILDNIYIYRASKMFRLRCVRDRRCETADNMSSKRADREKKAGYRDKYEIDDKLASPSRRARGRDRTTPP